MKSFYTGAELEAGSPATMTTSVVPIPTRARVAIYDGPGSAPKVEEVGSESVDGYIERLSARVYELAREQGGAIPYTVIREVSENFIHSDFAEPVVSILDRGNTVRFADQGPGIPDKDRALLPGYTTASTRMKSHIRGVGSGLPIVCDFLSLSGGALTIEDNLGTGAVVTIRNGGTTAPPLRTPVGASPSIEPLAHATQAEPVSSLLEEDVPPVARPRLSTRQKQVLALVMESGSAGPSIVSKELGVAISTAYRDLSSLEEGGLIAAAEGGKRRVTPEGLSYINDLMSGS